MAAGRSLPGWIYTVAARTALDEFDRENSADPMRAPLPLNDELLEALPAAVPEAGSGDTAVDEAVAAVLERLDAEDPRYRALDVRQHVDPEFETFTYGDYVWKPAKANLAKMGVGDWIFFNETLIVATNSTGGVMGKMIDAQSIMVACAACYEDPYERAHALGPIFRKVWWHSVAGAAVIGLIALIQAY